MARRMAGRLALAMTGMLTLAACEQGEGLNGLFATRGNATAGETDGTASVRLVDRDVEAPEVFKTTEAGLWDGRPSLGGVWVAYAGVENPERVIIRNEENGKFVIGALFRRERENPGPSIQVSSDAAEALGMLAGAPARLDVTALRRQEMPIAEDAPAAEILAAEPIETASLDGGADLAAAATAAIATAEAPPAPPTAAALPVQTAAAPATDPAPIQPSSLSKPYIQIGLFSVQQNADNTGVAMRSEGMIPLIEELTSSGKTYWRVVVGPAANTTERATLLRKVKELGFNDAYFVTK